MLFESFALNEKIIPSNIFDRIFFKVWLFQIQT